MERLPGSRPPGVCRMQRGLLLGTRSEPMPGVQPPASRHRGSLSALRAPCGPPRPTRPQKALASLDAIPPAALHWPIAYTGFLTRSCHGRARYPDASSLVILADCGGSNGYRTRAWKYCLQHSFCNVHRITVAVAHYPAGCSKWNPVEHRLFSEISRNWSGRPLKSLDHILNYIATTSTRTGLQVTSQPNTKQYKTGIRISDEQMATVNITPNLHIPKWNYTISPSPN